jgi:hypothetical protein
MKCYVSAWTGITGEKSRKSANLSFLSTKMCSICAVYLNIPTDYQPFLYITEYLIFREKSTLMKKKYEALNLQIRKYYFLAFVKKLQHFQTRVAL